MNNKQVNKMTSKREILTALLIFIFLISLSSKSNYVYGNSTVRDYWPTFGWQNKTFEEVDMDENRTLLMLDYADSQGYDLDGVVLVKDGYLILEEYPRPGHYTSEDLHNIYSITKSIIASLIGIAIEIGYVESVDQPILDFLYNASIPNIELRENITIYHLLTMTSGIKWIENEVSWGDPTNSHHNMYLSSNWVEFVLSQEQQYEPGTNYYYNSGGVHLLSAIIEEATGNTTLEFANEHLFGPLGFSDVSWDQDPQGIYIGGCDLYLLPIDMTKFGYLYLNNGTWNGTQIITKEWVQDATNAISDTPWGSYGYLWWVRPEINSYFGMGNLGQLIGIIPEYDIVVTFTSTFVSGYHFPFYIDDLIKNYVILAAEQGYGYTTPVETTWFPLVTTLSVLVMSVVIKRRKQS